ncbi:hypothetical protein U6A24_20980 [Aquimarina gracilis]|uniref:Bacteriocin-like protein n=1 Tax=Aquimarina gracilis TaxID=874422 RepID=A0ABU6A1J7_9FLAO|nr:hypothetical protein [Aquimarina gracilis]MEB3347962.1 hypothetical protein [Aquimarina gracilis]
MKKKNLKALKLNKKNIAILKPNTIKGGGAGSAGCSRLGCGTARTVRGCP